MSLPAYQNNTGKELTLPVPAGNTIIVKNGDVVAGDYFAQYVTKKLLVAYSGSKDPIYTIGTSNTLPDKFAKEYVYTKSHIAKDPITPEQATFDKLDPINVLGDLTYGNEEGSSVRLPGNTSRTKKFLSQTGTGSISAAPVWAALVSSDIPNNAADTSGNAATATTASNANTVTDGVYTTDTGTVTAKMLQNAAADLGDADININLSNSHTGNVTNLTLDGTITSTELVAKNLKLEEITNATIVTVIPTGSGAYTYTYAITGVTAQGIETNYITGTTTTSAYEVPDDGPNTVSWTAIPGINIYNVYRIAAPDSYLGLVATTSALQFIDTDQMADTTKFPPIYNQTGIIIPNKKAIINWNDFINDCNITTAQAGRTFTCVTDSASTATFVLPSSPPTGIFYTFVNSNSLPVLKISSLSANIIFAGTAYLYITCTGLGAQVTLTAINNYWFLSDIEGTIQHAPV